MVEIYDPQNILGRLCPSQKFISISEDLKCNSKKSYKVSTEYCTILECSTYGLCKSKCESPSEETQLDFFVENCQSDSVSIYSSNGIDSTLTQSDFQTGCNSWLLSVLKNIDVFILPAFGQLEIEMVLPKTFMKIENGKRTQVRGQLIIMEYHPFSGRGGIGVEIGFTTENEGLNKILFLKTGSDYFMKTPDIFEHF